MASLTGVTIASAREFLAERHLSKGFPPFFLEILNMKTSMIVFFLLFLGSCNDATEGGAFKDDEVKLKVFLRSAPGDQQDITFRMEHFEILFEHEGEMGAVITGKKVKELSLRDMNQKIPLSMDPVRLSAGALVKEIRLVLQPDDHILRRLDGSPCKLNLYNHETSITALVEGSRLESGVNYALVLEIAADSIMLDLGDKGECSARPDFHVRALKPLNHALGQFDEKDFEEEPEIIEEED